MAVAPPHVIHGFLNPPSESRATGAWGFSLEIDGVDPSAGSLINFPVDRNLLVKLRLPSFDEGPSAGTDELVGRWFWPCEEAVEHWGYAGTCRTPITPAEVFTVATSLVVIG